METDADRNTARVPVRVLAVAALALSRAARWPDAFAVLDNAEPMTADGRVALALAAAQVALERDYVTGTRTAAGLIAQASTLAAGSGNDADRWTVAYMQCNAAYMRTLRTPEGGWRFGPAGRDMSELDELRAQAARLLETAPDSVAGGWAEMALGYIADNLYGQRDVAPTHYAAALAAGEAAGDDLLIREALRHLGDHDHDCRDHAVALDRWQRATAAGARAGNVPGTLSQQLLLAVLARDAGDEAGARLLAGEIARWASAVGAVDIHAQAAAFLAGVDPTAPPTPAGSGQH
jgi:hypothetical protein